ncbi:MAG: DASS family sodium-coupled anion symporter, partial [Bacteroidota bacterium]
NNPSRSWEDQIGTRKPFRFGMSDSRHASKQHYTSFRRPFHTKLFYFVLSVGLAGGLTWLLGGVDLNREQYYILYLVFFAMTLWLTEAIPPFAVGLFIISYLVYTQGTGIFSDHPQDVSKYVNTWSSPVIWMMLGGFFMAEGLHKTNWDKFIFQLTLRIYGTHPPYLLLGLMLSTAFSSMVMSNTATTALMIASVMPFLKSLGVQHTFSKAVLLGIPTAASLGGMGTVIGSPPNAIAVGVLESHGIALDFLSWMFFGVPLGIGLLLFFWLVLCLRYSLFGRKLQADALSESPLFTSLKVEFQSFWVLFTLLLTLSLWLTTVWHGLSVAVISAIPIVFLTMSGLIRSEDVRKLPWDTLMLVAGGLALGLAISESGLAQYYIERVHLGDMKGNNYFLLFFFAYLTMIGSNFMSNTATSTIFLPIAFILSAAQSLELALII